MVYPHRPAAGLAAAPVPGTKAKPAWTARPPVQSGRRVLPLTRRYEVSVLATNGDIQTIQRVAPATPVFEEAFSAFARGALLATSNGLTAVEDLLPGDLLETVDQGLQPLRWVGSMMLYPNMSAITGADADGEDRVQLFRVTADAFGLEKPSTDVILGPRARVLFRHDGCHRLLGRDTAFAPVRAFDDGMSVIGVTPVSAQQVYHLVLDRQARLRVNGIEVESFHPGDQPEMLMDREMRELFLSLFPHMDTMADFGPLMVPRLTAFEVDSLSAA